jgi:predicted Rossmann-fold nucleotide-binding protein
MDELFEILTLVQTRKLEKKIAILLYGTDYWNEVVNFDAMVKHGTISPEDVNLFDRADDPSSAFEILKDKLTRYYLQKEPSTEPGAAPDIAKSRV